MSDNDRTGNRLTRFVSTHKGVSCTEREDDIDLGALHRQLGRDEPAPSLAAERAHPEPEPEPVPAPAPRPPTDRALPPAPDHRLEKIKKKIATLKRNISKYESDFEVEHGYPIGRSDRMTDVRLTRMYEALQRLQAEKRCIKADPVEYALRMQAAKLQKERDEKLDAQLKSDKPMAEVVRDIEEYGASAVIVRSCLSGAVGHLRAVIHRARHGCGHVSFGFLKSFEFCVPKDPIKKAVE
ncbi:hypothetical protein EVAR_61750_1 [Eumeta japonica]|uniref:Protein FAM13A n=1 Tax=Eumeta variegata TaxID=151549 RepID=A0A4C1YHU5_EUMVA|nr:hypothetical protein EVAR_61750_1 [Eumeta japonica]